MSNSHPDLLDREFEIREKQQYPELHVDSDAQIGASESDDEAYSESEVYRRTDIDYNMDVIEQIIDARDNHKWSLEHIHHRWTKISTNPSTARSQLTRYMKRGANGKKIANV